MKNSCPVVFGGVGLCGLDLRILVVVIGFGGLNGVLCMEWNLYVMSVLLL